MLGEERKAGVEEGRRVRKITKNVLQSRGGTVKRRIISSC